VTQASAALVSADDCRFRNGTLPRNGAVPDDLSRAKAVRDALAVGDDVARAVLHGPSMLSGFSAEAKEAVRRQWRQARHGAVYDPSRSKRFGRVEAMLVSESGSGDEKT
jgi:hypothetical protein